MSEKNDSQTQEILDGLVRRTLGADYQLQFRFIPTDPPSNGTSYFEIHPTTNGRIEIYGSDRVSLAPGFCHYLDLIGIDPDAINTNDVDISRRQSHQEGCTHTNPYRVRYFLNYCTFSYSMAFWDWPRWEKLLDWCAMHGVNMLLDLVGHEEVYRQLLRRYGYTEDEVRSFLPGAAYLPWFFMQNLTHCGSPLPTDWFPNRLHLAHRIHKRMADLGITPVFPGFTGVVPRDFSERNSGFSAIDSGTWCGFRRPAILDPGVTQTEREHYQEFALSYYTIQDDVFGKITHYYSADPLHEGGCVDPPAVIRIF